MKERATKEERLNSKTAKIAALRRERFKGEYTPFRNQEVDIKSMIDICQKEVIKNAPLV